MRKIRPPGRLRDEALNARRVIARRARLSRLALAVERVAAEFWPAWTVLALFLAFTLFGAFRLMPGWGHAAALAAFGVAFLFFAGRGILNFRAPTDHDGRARLEADAPDRPITTLEDELAVGAADPATRAIWALHQRRMVERALALRPEEPDLRLSARDTWGLRHVSLILVLAGGLATVGGGGQRLAEALSPDLAAPGALSPVVEAWAAPPTYTGEPTIYLTERIGDEIALPVGSALSIRVYNSPLTPKLTDEVSGLQIAFTPIGEDAYDARLEVLESGAVNVATALSTLGEWGFSVIPDHPPSIEVTDPPHAAATRALQFDFRAADDYGVVAAWAVIDLDRSKLDPGEAGPPKELEPIEIELPLPFTGSVTEAAETVIEDITQHPWAGLPATLTLHAEDARGQRGSTEPLAFEIPARRFYEPMARAFVEQRRDLAWSLDNARRAEQVLRAVTAYPEDYFEDASPYLVARTAIRRLTYANIEDRVAPEAASVMELLWRAALLLEDGDLTDAAERLRRAQERLAEAIEQGADQDEISRLMDELRQAMNEYLQEMMRQAMQNLDDMQAQQDQQQNGQTIDQQDLEDMLNAIEEAMRNGDQEAARQMLQALQQMLENLRMQAQQGQQGGEGQQTMEGLNDMLQQQQDLADRSFEEFRRRQEQEGMQGQRGQQGQQGQQGQRGQGGQQQGRPGPGQEGGQDGDPTGRLAQEQEALRRLLEQLREGLPQGLSEGAERALGEADRAMGDARDSLNEGNPGDAVDDQVQAMESLREGARELGEAMRQAQRNGQGDRAARGGPDGRERREDPFGRPTANNGAIDGGDVRVPDAEALKRARELLDEIRRRFGDRTRPEMELDYLERLLDRF